MSRVLEVNNRLEDIQTSGKQIVKFMAWRCRQVTLSGTMKQGIFKIPTVTNFATITMTKCTNAQMHTHTTNCGKSTAGSTTYLEVYIKTAVYGPMHLQQKLSIFALFYNAGLFQSLEGKYYFMSKERN